MSSKWVSATGENSADKNISYKKSLEDKDHRIAYHSSQCDKSKMHRGATLLPYNHPAMSPGLPLPSPGTALTENYIKERKKESDRNADNTINRMKHLRKK